MQLTGYVIHNCAHPYYPFDRVCKRGSYKFCNGAEIIARVAEAVPGAKFKRLAFPDAPPPGAPEMINYMRVNAADIIAAAEKMVRG